MFKSNYKPVTSLGKYIPQRYLAKMFCQIIAQNKLHERGERSSCWKMDIVEVSHGGFSIVLYAVREANTAIACAYSVPKKSYNAAYQAMCRL